MNNYIIAQGRLDKACSKTHISYMFDVKDPIKELCIEFTFEPSCLEDEEDSKKIIGNCLKQYSNKKIDSIDDVTKHFMPIRNLLTLSLDGPEGFRGATHRHCIKQHLSLTTESASPGLLPGAIELGVWTVTISIHAIATEFCNYTIKVYGEKADE